MIQSEVLQRQKVAPAPPPRELVLQNERVAGAYFTCLPGRLAILGAVQTSAKAERFGSRLLAELVSELRDQYSVSLVQAAVTDTDLVVQQMLNTSGFRYLATIDQMWLSISHLANSKIGLTANSNAGPNASRSDSGWKLRWTSANSISQETFLSFLESTFEGTLDCPELNELRSTADVLNSFLMGRKYADLSSWRIATDGEKIVGCLIMEDHQNSVSEIVYMGLAPFARQRGLGQQLVSQGVERAIGIGYSGIALAVDVRNLPALKTYARCGFRPLRRLKVYVNSLKL